MRRLWVSLILAPILAAACSPPGIAEVTATPATPAPAETPAPTGRPPAAQAALEALAAALGLPAGQIQVLSVEAVEWPDGCLGLSLPGQACAEAIVPGYLVELRAGGRVYEYRSNRTGDVLWPSSLALTWERNGGIAGFCDSLAVFASGEVLAANCRSGAGRLTGTLTASERAQLEEWLGAYGSTVIIDTITPMPADGMEVKLNLYGAGSGPVTEADEPVLVAWAQMLYTRLGQ
ncbi:MAG: hypothetical protein IT318_23205 [Anaerolineales bacterium]|nr:hypothetical protein [Anaerolineales bacterium]